MEAYFSLLRIITILSAHIFLKELTLSVVGKKFNVKKTKTNVQINNQTEQTKTKSSRKESTNFIYLRAIIMRWLDFFKSSSNYHSLSESFKLQFSVLKLRLDVLCKN